MSKVKIDPESREDMLQLIYASDYLTNLLMDEPANASGPDGYSTLVSALQDAFREFKNGRIKNEPTGVGAVVADIYGDKWVRAAPDDDPIRWVQVASPDAEWRAWEDIRVTDVYSEGTRKGG
jgi:hypothetical protein